MAYHEIRKENGKKKNYLIENKRVNGKFKKKSKFIGYGVIPKKELLRIKEKFQDELIKSKKYKFLSKTQIDKLESLRKDYNKKLKNVDKENFNEVFSTELTYNSNAIEGNTLSLQETSLVINDGILPEGKTLREVNEVKNHLEAINFILGYKGDLNELFILKIHKLILKDIFPRFTGVYRDRNVRIAGSTIKLPDHNKIPSLMKNLIYWYKENKNKLHPYELAILFSMKFVTIHPFIDGNGRVSRLLMNFLLGKFKYPWINIKFRSRAKYLLAVRKANDNNYKKIIEFCIKELEKNIEELF
jgi:Fic family protein